MFENFWNTYGFSFDKKNKEVKEINPSVIPPTNDDAAYVVGADYFSRSYQAINFEQSFDTENELIVKYRQVSLMPEVSKAVNEIVNQAIVGEGIDDIVAIDLDALEMPESIKEKIRTEFSEILRLMNFNADAYEQFRKWYVDGRAYYHVIVDDNTKKGIKELRYVSPLNIKKIREEIKEFKKGVEQVVGYKEYYVYTNDYFKSRYQGLRISPDSIIYNTSGLIDDSKNMVYSYLHNALVPVNKLRMMETAILIYRITRAPERRVFYVDVGNLPKGQAEKYLKNIITRYKNKMVFDTNNGEVKDQNNTLSMLEDIWLPRREGGKGTEVTTLPGGQNLGEIQDIEYFEKKLYESLNVPIGRLNIQQTQTFGLGRSAEISREEVNFTKFVSRLRKKFSNIFLRALRIQLILKGILKDSEWEAIKHNIVFNWEEDSYFAELKDAEILKDRIAMLDMISPHIGKYFSKEYVQKKILMLSEDDITEIQKQIDKEIKDGTIPDPNDIEEESGIPQD